MHPARARHIIKARHELYSAGIEEVHPMTAGLDQKVYQLNLRLWVLLHNGPEFFRLTPKEQAFHKQFSSWGYVKKNRL